MYINLTNCTMVFKTKLVLKFIRDALPLLHNDSLIYLFYWSLGSCYNRRTNKRLDARIKQHALTKIRNFIGAPTDNLRNTYRSSIAEHLINNRDR